MQECMKKNRDRAVPWADLVVEFRLNVALVPITPAEVEERKAAQAKHREETGLLARFGTKKEKSQNKTKINRNQTPIERLTAQSRSVREEKTKSSEKKEVKKQENKEAPKAEEKEEAPKVEEKEVKDETTTVTSVGLVLPTLPKGRSRYGILFPGQGTQQVGMCRNLLDVAGVREMFAKASEILGFDLLDLCLNGPTVSHLNKRV